ncbi:MAG: ABC transporter permease [Desulfobacterales bacterium]|nr:ABC transporter permease [Desulfobacterales bacterium]
MTVNSQSSIISPIRIIRAFLWRDILNEVSYKLSFFLQLLSALPVVLMFFFLSRIVGNNLSTGPLHPYGGNYFPFVLIGIAVQNYLTLSLSSFSGSLRESQLSGTLEAILSAPVSLPVFILGSTAYSFVLNSFRILLYLGIGVLFGVKFQYTQLLAATGVIILTIAAFSSLGIFSASFIILFKKGDPLNWAFSVLSWLMGGVYYPISVLPHWMQEAANFIPTTHALEALRMSLLGGHGFSAITGHLLALAMWALIGLPLSLVCFRFAMNIARKNGTLGHY